MSPILDGRPAFRKVNDGIRGAYDGGMRILLFLLLPLSTLLAQWEVSGGAGYGRTYDDEGSLGEGVVLQAGTMYRVSPRLGVGFEYARIAHERDIAGGALLFRGHAQHFSGNAYLHLGTRGLQPYFVGGLGAVHYTNRNRSVRFGGDRSATGWGLNGGFGVKAYASENVFFKPEVRVWLGGGGINRATEPPLSALVFSFGVGYAW
jgi:hypothetical protein